MKKKAYRAAHNARHQVLHLAPRQKLEVQEHGRPVRKRFLQLGRIEATKLLELNVGWP
jgi:hypothetical protein